jgi:hypothetical protein
MTKPNYNPREQLTGSVERVIERYQRRFGRYAPQRPGGGAVPRVEDPGAPPADERASFAVGADSGGDQQIAAGDPGGLLDIIGGTDISTAVVPGPDGARVFVNAEAALARLADLAGTGSGEGASLIGVEDSAGNFTGDDVELVLAELAGMITGDYIVQTWQPTGGAYGGSLCHWNVHFETSPANGATDSPVAVENISSWDLTNHIATSGYSLIKYPTLYSGSRWTAGNLAIWGAFPRYRPNIRIEVEAIRGAYTTNPFSSASIVLGEYGSSTPDATQALSLTTSWATHTLAHNYGSLHSGSDNRYYWALEFIPTTDTSCNEGLFNFGIGTITVTQW